MKKILILAGDIDGNLGDNAIVLSTCEDIRKMAPDIGISIVSDNPAIYHGQLTNLNVIPKGMNGLPKLIQAARTSDLLLCGGGGLFQDDDSLIKMPYWGLRLALMRLFCGNIVGYCLGVGPLNFSLSRVFAQLAFGCMRRIAVRDPQAEKTARPRTSRAVELVPDPALLLTPRPVSEAVDMLRENTIPLDGSPLIGVALRRWFHNKRSFIPHKYAVKYRLRSIPGKKECLEMVRMLAEVFDRMIDYHGAHIVFMPTYNVSHEADSEICMQVADAMSTDRYSMLLIKDPKQYKAVTGCLDVMLGGRMHPTIFAAAAGTPIVGLAYNQKFKGFFELLGCEDALLGIDEFVRQKRTDDLVLLLSSALRRQGTSGDKVKQLQERIAQFNKEILDDIKEPLH